MSGPAALRIPQTLLEQISRAAEDAYPDECCGLLVGRVAPNADVVVTRVEASQNVADAGIRDRFEVDPALRFRIMRELGDGPLGIVGHYHSHPDHPAEPSARDLEMAFEPELVWLIVSVAAGRAAATAAHAIDAAAQAAGRPRFRAIALKIAG